MAVMMGQQLKALSTRLNFTLDLHGRKRSNSQVSSDIYMGGWIEQRTKETRSKARNQTWWCTPMIPGRRAKEFKAILGYMVSSLTAWASGDPKLLQRTRCTLQGDICAWVFTAVLSGPIHL